MLDKENFSINRTNMDCIDINTMGTAVKIHLHTRNRASQILGQLSSVHSRLFWASLRRVPLSRSSQFGLMMRQGHTRSNTEYAVEDSWNVMAHALKSDFIFRRNGEVHVKRRGRQFSRLLAAEVCASAIVMVDTPCPEVVWILLATHSIRQFPLHFSSRASPRAITFQLESTRITRHCRQS